MLLNHGRPWLQVVRQSEFSIRAPILGGISTVFVKLNDGPKGVFLVVDDNDDEILIGANVKLVLRKIYAQNNVVRYGLKAIINDYRHSVQKPELVFSAMAEWGFRKGRREAADNLSYNEEGDCPRCGGEKQPSTIAGYLSCIKCGYEWRDPNHVTTKRGPPETYRRDAELIDEFKKEMAGGELSNVLGIDKGLSNAQEASLKRLEDKWMSGMSGHFNAAAERKPLMISFDDDDNLVDTTIGSITIVANGFDGGEEIRLEYPGLGTEFYVFDEATETGWRKGRSAEDTARSITMVINKFSNLVYANQKW